MDGTLAEGTAYHKIRYGTTPPCFSLSDEDQIFFPNRRRKRKD